THPLCTNVCAGAVVSFAAAARGTPAPTMQWQANSGSGFTNIPGATSSPLSFTASISQSNNQFRAVFSNTCGSVTSAVAALTINKDRKNVVKGNSRAYSGAVSEHQAKGTR